MTKNKFEIFIPELKNYIKQSIVTRSKLSTGNVAHAAEIWDEGLRAYRYLLDVSTENLRDIRFHTTLFSGDSIHNYWLTNQDPQSFVERYGYNFYVDEIPEKYHVSEPYNEGGPIQYGILYKNKLLNRNIVRYQSCITNLYLMGVDELLSSNDGKNIIVEIGSGYGGLSHSLGEVFDKKSVVVLVDFPEMFIFSGTYLALHNQGKKICMYNETYEDDFFKNEIYDYDFVLLPNHLFDKLFSVDTIKLFISTISFQEMTEEQIRKYLKLAQDKCDGYLYSDNVDVHPFNNHLPPSSVEKLISEMFQLFPSVDFYKKDFISEKLVSKWNLKKYFGISNKYKDTVKFIDGCSIRCNHDYNRFRVRKKNDTYEFDRERNYLALIYYIIKFIKNKLS